MLASLRLKTLKYVVLVFPLFIILPNTGLAQSDSLYLQAKAQIRNGNYQKGIAQLKVLLTDKQPDTQIEKATYLAQSGFAYFRLYENDSTIKYMEAAFREKEKILTASDTFLFKGHAVLGYVYRYEQADYRRAAHHYDSERKIMEAHPDIATPDQRYQNYYNLATTNRVLQDFDRSLNYAYQALNAIPARSPNADLYRENCYSAIANSLSGKGKHREAVQFYLRKLNTSKLAGNAKNASLALDYYNLALNYNDLIEPDKSLPLFRQAEKLVPNSQKAFLSNIYRGIGVAYRLMGKKELFVEYLNKALPFAKGSPMREAWIHQRMANYLETEGRFEEALDRYQQGFKALIPDFVWELNTDNPSLQSLKLANPYVHKLLGLKAACMQNASATRSKSAALAQSLMAYRRLDSLTSHYRVNLVLESSRLFFQQKNHHFYEAAASALSEMYEISGESSYIEELWTLIEKNKSSLLLESLLMAENATGFQLPDSVVQVTRTYSNELLKMQKELNACAVSQDCEEATLSTLRKTAAEQEDGLRRHKETIKSDFPNYYNITEESGTISLGLARQSLKEGQVLLNYFATDDQYFLISASQKGSSLHRIERTDSLETLIELYLTEVSGKQLAETGIAQAYQNFTLSGHRLFQQLLPDDILNEDIDELVIIPDDQLANLPFEALLTSDKTTAINSFASLPYLIRDYEVQYGFSASLWAKNKARKQATSSPKMVAFATSAQSYAGLAQLPAIEEEVKSLGRLGGNNQVYANQGATASMFRQEAKDADLIHLALHNINDYENPLNSRLLLEKGPNDSGGEVYLYEIFNLEMSPQLVVLSGCDTGLGKWQKGEGAYHMGRGFLYHGNPAMIISLWKARDRPTARIMGSFYAGLEKELNTTEAIRQAKLQFIGESDEINAHPSNWAAFVGVGKMQLGGATQNYLLLVIMGGMMLLLLGYWGIKKAALKRAA